MKRPALLSAGLLAVFFLAAMHTRAQALAATPPMGWNSWDAYGLAIDEDQFKANVTVLASLKPYGWNYAVIDQGWYMANPTGRTMQQKFYRWNSNGLLIPAPDRFPSAADGNGFKPLADWVHAQGLKFGIHIVRGIPRQVAAANLPIAGSGFHTAEAADPAAPCLWYSGNWGVKDNAAGQAYYDSMLKLYASWGVDFLKVDCIADHPYRPTEIRQIAEAIRKTGRAIVLSLSPGPTAISHAGEVAQYVQMWRIAGDHWDRWEAREKPPEEFPVNLKEAFDLLALWNPYVAPGHWPDPDMLPEGLLAPSPGWGHARQSELTPDEQRTEFTLWCMARAPLFFGGNLTRLDALSRSLLTNRTLLSIDQNARESHPVDVASLGPAFSHVRVWRATVMEPGAREPVGYLAFFNLGDSPIALAPTWKQLGVNEGRHTVRDVWKEEAARESRQLSVSLPPHGGDVFEVR
jgi:hypothetical protein